MICYISYSLVSRSKQAGEISHGGMYPHIFVMERDSSKHHSTWFAKPWFNQVNLSINQPLTLIDGVFLPNLTAWNIPQPTLGGWRPLLHASIMFQFRLQIHLTNCLSITSKMWMYQVHYEAEFAHIIKFILSLSDHYSSSQINFAHSFYTAMTYDKILDCLWKKNFSEVGMVLLNHEHLSQTKLLVMDLRVNKELFIIYLHLT